MYSEDLKKEGMMMSLLDDVSASSSKIESLDMEKEEMFEMLSEMRSLLRSLEERSSRQEEMIALLEKKLSAMEAENAALKAENRALKDKADQHRLAKDELYTTGRKTAKRDKDKTDRRGIDKENYDGTPESLEPAVDGQENQSEESSLIEKSECVEVKVSSARPYRKGLKYGRSSSDKVVRLKSRTDIIPEGSKIIGHRDKVLFYSYNYIEEVHFDMLKVKLSDGRIVEMYEPENPEDKRRPNQDQNIGTRMSHEMSAELTCSKVLNSMPMNRLMEYYKNDGTNMCLQTMNNAMMKTAEKFKPLMPFLRERAVKADSVVNCDETWCEVKKWETEIGKAKYKKMYVWDMVNEAEKVACFVYDEQQNRRSEVAKRFFADAGVTVMTDGYGGYLFMDKDGSKQKHIVCNAHSLRKFKDANEIDKSPEVDMVLFLYGGIYDVEAKVKGLPPEEKWWIRHREAEPLFKKLRALVTKMYKKTFRTDCHYSGTLIRAIKYFINHADALQGYLENGRYPIDNNLAERTIRRMTIGRKNFNFFGSPRAAEAMTILYSIVETCKMNAVSVRNYIVKYLKLYDEGRRDFENMLPMTLTLSTT